MAKYLYAFLCGVGAWYCTYWLGMNYNLPLAMTWLAWPAGLFFGFTSWLRMD